MMIGADNERVESWKNVQFAPNKALFAKKGGAGTADCFPFRDFPSAHREHCEINS